MKKRLFLLSAGLLFTITILLAQDVPVGVVLAFKKGSSQDLNKYLNDKVEVIIQNTPKSIDKELAESVLSAFFADSKVSNFTVNHQGKRDDSSFIIGTLATTNGNYRVNCFFRRLQNKYLIHQIRIDKIND